MNLNMQYKQRSLSASHHCMRRDFQQFNHLQQKPMFKDLQSERYNRKSQSPRKKNFLCDSPYYGSTGPNLFAIQKLEAEWKEFKENMCDSDRMHKSAKDLSLRNRLSKNSTTDGKFEVVHRLAPRLKDSYEEDDTDDAPIVIQRVKAFNTARQSKHFVPVTRISLQDQCVMRKRSDSTEIKMFHTLSSKSKEKKDFKLEDVTNDNYLNKVKSRFSKKILPLTEVSSKENRMEIKSGKERKKADQKKRNRNTDKFVGLSIPPKSIRTPISLKLNVNSPIQCGNYQTVTSQMKADTDKGKKESKPGESHSKLKKFLNNKIKSKAR